MLAYRLAARLELEAERFAHARNHLRAALRLDAYDAELHYELGLAFENDPEGCDLRAARRFRRAVQLHSQNAKYPAALGRSLVRLNRVRTGVKMLRDAANLAPADPKVLAVVVNGLIEAGRPKLAERIVVKARFRRPNDRAVMKLWNDVRFALAQKRPKRTARPAGKVLPFLKIVGAETVSIVRREGRSARPAPHFGRLRAFGAE